MEPLSLDSERKVFHISIQLPIQVCDFHTFGQFFLVTSKGTRTWRLTALPALASPFPPSFLSFFFLQRKLSLKEERPAQGARKIPEREEASPALLLVSPPFASLLLGQGRAATEVSHTAADVQNVQKIPMAEKAKIAEGALNGK